VAVEGCRFFSDRTGASSCPTTTGRNCRHCRRSGAGAYYQRGWSMRLGAPRHEVAARPDRDKCSYEERSDETCELCRGAAKECYGAVVGDGVVTLKGHALPPPMHWPAGALGDMRETDIVGQAGTTGWPTSVSCPLFQTTAQKSSAPGVNLQIPRRRGFGRELPKQAEHVSSASTEHKRWSATRGEMIRPPGFLSDNFSTSRVRIDHGDRQRRAAHIPIEARARSMSAGYTDLRRRQRARLPEVSSVTVGQELAGQPARSALGSSTAE